MGGEEVGGEAPAQSREGRERQRYSPDGARLVCGTIPVRFKPSSGGQPAFTGPQDVEVLLVSCRGRSGMSFPKGGWEDDEPLEAAAKRETVEEAGVRGHLEEPMLGTFPFAGGKTACIAYMYVLHVVEELDVWPEAKQRKRRWVSEPTVPDCPLAEQTCVTAEASDMLPLAEASALCRHEWMREALSRWIELKGWKGLVEPEGGAGNVSPLAPAADER